MSFHFVLTTLKGGYFYILKMRLREVGRHAQGDAARQTQSWELNPGSLTRSPGYPVSL